MMPTPPVSPSLKIASVLLGADGAMIFNLALTPAAAGVNKRHVQFRIQSGAWATSPDLAPAQNTFVISGFNPGDQLDIQAQDSVPWSFGGTVYDVWGPWSPLLSLTAPVPPGAPALSLGSPPFSS
jgi:hypothetical protein